MDRASAYFCEALTTGEVLEQGLAATARVHPPNEDCFVALLFLSAGLERLCKLLIWRDAISAGTSVPTRFFRGSRGHNIPVLLHRVIRTYLTTDYLRLPEARDDFKYLTTNELVAEFISLVAEFADTRGRYYEMNVLASQLTGSIHRMSAWRSWDESLTQADPKLRHVAENVGGLQYMWELSARRVAVIECLLRALCRLLSPGLRPTEQTLPWTEPLRRFAQMPDDAFGSSWYSARLRDPFRGRVRESLKVWRRIPIPGG